MAAAQLQSEHRGVHDRISGTMVTRARDLVPDGRPWRQRAVTSALVAASGIGALVATATLLEPEHREIYVPGSLDVAASDDPFVVDLHAALEAPVDAEPSWTSPDGLVTLPVDPRWGDAGDTGTTRDWIRPLPEGWFLTIRASTDTFQSLDEYEASMVELQRSRPADLTVSRLERVERSDGSTMLYVERLSNGGREVEVSVALAEPGRRAFAYFSTNDAATFRVESRRILPYLVRLRATG